jgi:(p)ppGpp synthase/HD superfamily hydrolase
MDQQRYERALAYAKNAHAGQLRKYTYEPYWHHVRNVAQLVTAHVPAYTMEMVEAALLHDTVEDTPVTIDQINHEFGQAVAMGVDFLTDWHDLPPRVYNREKRKRLYAERLALAPPWVQTVKLADLIDNSDTIVRYDPNFARVYLKEKRAVLGLLQHAAKPLRTLAERTVAEAERSLQITSTT